MKPSIMYLFLALAFVSIHYVQGQGSLTIDLNQESSTQSSVAGFLHVNNFGALQENINILKPRYWRIGATVGEKGNRDRKIALMLKNKIVPILVLSDIYGYKNPRNLAKGWVSPSTNDRKFKDLLQNICSDSKDKIIYDIWNEPNYSFWKGSQNDYFKTFKIAHDIIRSQPNGQNYLITGPSTAGFDKNYIEHFLQYCADNNIKLDILNWHENGSAQGAISMQDHIKYAKDVWMKKFSKVGIKEIFIPEITSKSDQFNPLTVFAYLFSLEKSGASGGCKSCWENPTTIGGNSCWNNSMDGIFDPKGNPRSVWWVYKLYAESLDKRLGIQSNNSSLLGMAYTTLGQDTLKVLVGTTAEGSSATIALTQIKRLSNWANSTKIKVEMYQLANSEAIASQGPQLMESMFIKLKANSLNYKLKNLNSNNLYLLKFYK